MTDYECPRCGMQSDDRTEIRNHCRDGHGIAVLIDDVDLPARDIWLEAS